MTKGSSGTTGWLWMAAGLVVGGGTACVYDADARCGDALVLGDDGLCVCPDGGVFSEGACVVGGDSGGDGDGRIGHRNALFGG